MKRIEVTADYLPRAVNFVSFRQHFTAVFLNVIQWVLGFAGEAASNVAHTNPGEMVLDF
jgi:hypothetical protein